MRRRKGTGMTRMNKSLLSVLIVSLLALLVVGGCGYSYKIKAEDSKNVTLIYQGLSRTKGIEAEKVDKEPSGACDPNCKWVIFEEQKKGEDGEEALYTLYHCEDGTWTKKKWDSDDEKAEPFKIPKGSTEPESCKKCDYFIVKSEDGKHILYHCDKEGEWGEPIGEWVEKCPPPDASKIKVSRGTAATGGMIIHGADGAVKPNETVIARDRNGKESRTSADENGSFTMREVDLPDGFDHAVDNKLAITQKSPGCAESDSVEVEIQE